MDYLATYANADDDVTALVYALRGGFAVALRDDGCGLIVPTITIYPTLEAAKVAAARAANVVAA